MCETAKHVGNSVEISCSCSEVGDCCLLFTQRLKLRSTCLVRARLMSSCSGVVEETGRLKAGGGGFG